VGQSVVWGGAGWFGVTEVVVVDLWEDPQPATPTTASKPVASAYVTRDPPIVA
jgi:hypothetical protein